VIPTVLRLSRDYFPKWNDNICLCNWDVAYLLCGRKLTFRRAYGVSNNALCGDNFRLSFLLWPDYQWLNRLSDFHEIWCRSSLQKVYLTSVSFVTIGSVIIILKGVIACFYQYFPYFFWLVWVKFGVEHIHMLEFWIFPAPSLVTIPTGLLRLPKGAGVWRKLHSEEVNSLHFSSKIIWVTKDMMGRTCGMHAREEKYRVLVRIRKGKRQPAKRRRRWENNIKTHCLKIG
jgi:hypothetical protein